MKLRLVTAFCVVLASLGCRTLATSDLSLREGLGELFDLAKLSPETRAEICARNLYFALFAQTETGELIAAPQNTREENNELRVIRKKIDQQTADYFDLVREQAERIHAEVPQRDSACEAPEVRRIMDEKGAVAGEVFVATIIDGPGAQDSAIEVSWSGADGFIKRAYHFSATSHELLAQDTGELFLSRDINEIADALHVEALRLSGSSGFKHYVYALKGHSGLITQAPLVQNLGELLASTNTEFAQAGLFEAFDEQGKRVAPLYYLPVWSKEVVCAHRFPVRDIHYERCLEMEYYVPRRSTKVAAQGGATDAGQGAATDAGQGAATDAGQGAATDAGQGAATDAGQGAATDAGQGVATDAGQGLTFSNTQGLGGLSEYQGMGKAAIYKSTDEQGIRAYLASLDGPNRPLAVAVLGAGVSPMIDLRDEGATVFSPPYRGSLPSLFVGDTCFASHFIGSKVLYPHGITNVSLPKELPEKVRHMSLIYPGPTNKKALSYGDMNATKYVALLSALWESSAHQDWLGASYKIPSPSVLFGNGAPEEVDQAPLHRFARVEAFSKRSRQELIELGNVLLPHVLDGPARPLEGTPQDWMSFALGHYVCGEMDDYRFGWQYSINPIRCAAQPPTAQNHLDKRLQSVANLLLEHARLYEQHGDRESFAQWLKVATALAFWSELKHGSRPPEALGQQALAALLAAVIEGDSSWVENFGKIGIAAFKDDAVALAERVSAAVRLGKPVELETQLTFPARLSFYAMIWHAVLAKGPTGTGDDLYRTSVAAAVYLGESGLSHSSSLQLASDFLSRLPSRRYLREILNGPFRSPAFDESDDQAADMENSLDSQLMSEEFQKKLRGLLPSLFRKNNLMLRINLGLPFEKEEVSWARSDGFRDEFYRLWNLPPFDLDR